jgi:hypothetical protein
MLAAILQMVPGKFMDIQMNVSGEYMTKVIERPGLWMQESELAKLTKELRDVASKTLPAGDLEYGVFSGDKTRLENAIITVVYRRDNNKPIAFNALALMQLHLGKKPVDVLHLGLVMVDPDERSRGLSWILYGLTCFLMFLRNQMRPIWISNVTQVPAVVGMVSETFDNVYPTPIREKPRSLTHVLLARQIMADHRHVFGVGEDATFDEEHFVIQNAYTGGSDNLKKTFDQAPKHREAAFNDFCHEMLDYDRGDDVIQLGQLTYLAAITYVTQTVPRGSLSALVLAAGSAVLQRLVLPLWYWTDNTRDWGPLRART